MPAWEQLRHEMVERQLRGRGIRDEKVLQAMDSVPRHEFIPDIGRRRAYADEPQPIGAQQTISQPYMVAVMAESLTLSGAATVLEIGGGSGYAAAVMALLSRHVYSMEREPALVNLARDNLARAGFAGRVTVIAGDGTLGCPRYSPFQAISVAAAAPDVPPPLLEQLHGEGGRMVIPVGSAHDQELRLIRKFDDRVEQRTVTACRFVPLRGERAWQN